MNVKKQLNIRRATSADRADWLRMRQALWPEDDIETLELGMDSTLADPLMPVFVVERADGKLGGFLEASARKYADGALSSPVGYIEGWFVDEDLRGQGVGKALMQTAEDWARGLGMTEMGSDTWLDNEISIKAHLAAGYEEVERLVHFLKTL
ncbi:MAG TPA: GNAT family N-acetyltransferase [Anaerolineales bacterium]|nr:GNAT family N-acetyltransferase [Anaerolineales bacterium]